MEQQPPQPQPEDRPEPDELYPALGKAGKIGTMGGNKSSAGNFDQLTPQERKEMEVLREFFPRRGAEKKEE